MLAKMTAKNQLTLPKGVTEAVGATDYFEVAVVGLIMDTIPARGRSLTPSAGD
jgi:hypothetical protein